MSDLTPILERARSRFVPPDLPLDAILRRSERRNRNRRIAATVVGLSITVAVVAGGAAILRTSPPPAQPAPPTPTGPSEPEPPGPTLAPAPAGLGPILREGEVLRTDTRGAPIAVGSGGRRELAPCRGACISIFRPAVSPDGRWLAYEVMTCFNLLPCEDQAGVWVQNALGERIQLTHPCDPDACPRPDSWAWMPTGAGIVAATGERLQLFDLVTGEQRTLASGTGPSWASAVAPSPDGSRVAYTDRAATWVVDVGGGDPTLVGDVSDVTTIAWSQDGARIVVDATTDADRMYVLASDGSAPGAAPIVEQEAPEGPGAPAWSPDGTRIAYVTTPREADGFAFEIWTVGPDGSDPVRVAAMPCCVGDWEGPVWSPDGGRIAFDYEYAWYAVPADGAAEPREIDVDTVDGWRSARADR